MKKGLKVVLWVIVALLMVAILGFAIFNLYKAKTEDVVHPVATFEIKDYGTVKMELYPEYAPNTVANFIKLIESGYYNNKVIYGKDDVCLYVGRNEEGEAEAPKASLIDSSIEADSDSDYDYSINGEFVANGFNKNTLAFEKGIISLIRDDYTRYFQDLSDESYNSGNAQIGIMLGDNLRTLNGIYAGFGKITEGLDIVEKIYNEAEVQVSEDEEKSSSTMEIFANYPVITSASVDTFGNDYGIPEIHEQFNYNQYLNEKLSSYYTSQE